MNPKRQRILLLIMLVVLAGVVARRQFFRHDRFDDRDARREESAEKREAQQRGLNRGSDAGFDRSITRLSYSKHARCRMDCRKIDESEVIEIKNKGRVNLAGTELRSNPDPKYALEGITRDKQHVRIVFAQKDGSLVVVTVIDLDTDWTCHCN